MGKVSAKVIAAGLLAVGLVLGLVALVAADDGNGDVEISRRERFPAADCTAGAATTRPLHRASEHQTHEHDACHWIN